MTSNFHADIVGSYLRPPELTDAKLHNMPVEEVRPIEDRAILDILKVQEDAGLNIVTDGEYRRAYWMQGISAIMDGFALTSWNGEPPFIVPYPVGKLAWKASLVDLELAFLRQHTMKPIKITMPSPTIFLGYWREGVSDKAYASKTEFINDAAGLLNSEFKALAAAGAAYVQLDAPHYTLSSSVPEHNISNYEQYVEWDNRVLEGVTGTPGVVTGFHMCRGNGPRPKMGVVPYDPYAEVVFGRLNVNRLLLEYDDFQAGDFAPLRFVPPHVTVVLGLVTTKYPTLEDEDTLIRRIEEASQYVPLERLAISPQCGFASYMEQSNTSRDVQKAKLELLVRVAERVWGHA
jgi:5-methyltetrahydropteroyltriglutamate--homocysteine methyltransferase